MIMDIFIHPSSFVDEGAKIGDGTKIWFFCHIQSGAVIGENCSLGQNVNIANNVTIGKGVKIQNNVSIYEGVTLGDYVFCGPSCVFTNDLNPRARFPKGSQGYLPTRVGDGATIGANATIVCGHNIGHHAMIAAGAVINKNIPNYAVMVGVPARQIGWACACGKIFVPDDLEEGKSYTCPTCGRAYLLGENGLEEVQGPTNQKYEER